MRSRPGGERDRDAARDRRRLAAAGGNRREDRSRSRSRRRYNEKPTRRRGSWPRTRSRRTIKERRQGGRRDRRGGQRQARTRCTGRRCRSGDQAELYRQALKAAVADARASAQALASRRRTSRSVASRRSSRAAASSAGSRSPPRREGDGRRARPRSSRTHSRRPRSCSVTFSASDRRRRSEARGADPESACPGSLPGSNLVGSTRLSPRRARLPRATEGCACDRAHVAVRLGAVAAGTGM